MKSPWSSLAFFFLGCSERQRARGKGIREGKNVFVSEKDKRLGHVRMGEMRLKLEVRVHLHFKCTSVILLNASVQDESVLFNCVEQQAHLIEGKTGTCG